MSYYDEQEVASVRAAREATRDQFLRSRAALLRVVAMRSELAECHEDVAAANRYASLLAETLADDGPSETEDAFVDLRALTNDKSHRPVDYYKRRRVWAKIQRDSPHRRYANPNAPSWA